VWGKRAKGRFRLESASKNIKPKGGRGPTPFQASRAWRKIDIPWRQREGVLRGKEKSGKRNLHMVFKDEACGQSYRGEKQRILRRNLGKNTM